MSEYINLIGAEDVRCAGRSISSAAADMQRAANQITEALVLHQRFMDIWLCQFRQAIEKLTKEKNENEE
jgi:hypothetical protein